MRIVIFIFLLFLLGPLYILLTQQVDFSTTWQRAFRGSAHIAPLPQDHPGALVQVYAARAFNWRGLFSDHVWIAIKPEHAKQYTTFQVIGWYLFYGKSSLVVNKDLPDRYWFGNKPRLILSVSGEQAKALIPQIENAVKSYPYSDRYIVWPGPNSNTFIAYVARQVPALGLVLPPSALGQDFLGTRIFAKAPSGTGYQFSLAGVLGITLALKEGLRFNMFGLNFGISFMPVGIILPSIGVVVLLPW
ncbi:MAG: hypothetical protein K0S08_1886 [Gammaproteobacteria bacterium]|nr:hypothetical protein [Gammaproteobacteria bacterium]